MTARSRPSPHAARPGAPRGAADEAGLSSVLGAILLFGLLVSTLATLQAQYVPVWDAQREGRLMDELSSQMAQLQADLARQVANRTDAPLGAPVTLAPAGGFALFTGSSQPGVLEFRPAGIGAGLTVASTRLTIQGQDGVGLYVLSEDWRSVADGATVPDVEAVDHLRLRIADPEQLHQGDFLTLTVLDADGAYAGKLVITNRDSGSEYSLVRYAYGAASPTLPLTEATDGWKKTATDQGHYYLDALQPGFGFGAVLSAAKAPLTLVWDSSMPRVESALVYTSTSSGQMGVTGAVLPDYRHQLQGGRLVAHRENQRFPAQAYILEYGALIVEQPDGAAMVVPPAFDVRQAHGQVRIEWAVPELTGGAGGVAGARSGHVAAAPLGPRLDLDALAPRLAFTLDTEHPSVWAGHWHSALRAAGLRESLGHYRVATTAGTATLEVFGLQADPASPVDDLVLRFKESTVAVSLLPSG